MFAVWVLLFPINLRASCHSLAETSIPTPLVLLVLEYRENCRRAFINLSVSTVLEVLLVVSVVVVVVSPTLPPAPTIRERVSAGSSTIQANGLDAAVDDAALLLPSEMVVNTCTNASKGVTLELSSIDDVVVELLSLVVSVTSLVLWDGAQSRRGELHSKSLSNGRGRDHDDASNWFELKEDDDEVVEVLEASRAERAKEGRMRARAATNTESLSFLTSSPPPLPVSLVVAV